MQKKKKIRITRENWILTTYLTTVLLKITEYTLFQALTGHLLGLIIYKKSDQKKNFKG